MDFAPLATLKNLLFGHPNSVPNCIQTSRLLIRRNSRLRLVQALRETNQVNGPWSFPGQYSCPRTMFIKRAFITTSHKGVLETWNYISKVYLRGIEDMEMAFDAILLAAGSCYGGVHLIAWNGPLHTLTERWL